MSHLYPSRPTTLPARFRRQRLLIVGCGDIGVRVARLLHPRMTIVALSSSATERAPTLRAAGVRHVLQGNLDVPASLARVSGLATRVLHLAPPPPDTDGSDPRTQTLLAGLRQRSLPAVLVYGSTSGVYGDCGGALIDETQALNPATARARRRVDAERRVRAWGQGTGTSVAVLRIPGIYAADREGGTPADRLQRGVPVLRAEDDVYSSHVHADDLARACVLALWRSRPGRTYHVCDDTRLLMGDYFDRAADLLGLPRPPRVDREQAQKVLSPMMYSFMTESRQLDNTRMKAELGLDLQYATVDDGLALLALRSRPA